MAKLSSTNIYGDLTVDGIIRGTVNGSITGNAATATALQNARTINGTSFNGTANITTANWGTARNITIGNTAKSVNGSAAVSWSLSEIGAAASGHTHSYLPLSGGTMTGKITTPNNAQGITIGDDIHLCDRNIADHLVLEGSTATNGGITFGSGKDTNIYRGGANLLKTDDTFNAVGGFQWNGTSLDSRYAAASHGTHLTIGTGASNAAAGNHTHNYAGSGSAGGAANSVKTNLTIKLNGGTTEGTNLFTFNGSTAKTINITPSSIGAAASHSHSYLPLSGGTLTGAVKNASLPGTWVSACNGNAMINSDMPAGNFHPMLSAKTTNGGMTLAFYQAALQAAYITKANCDSNTNTVGKVAQIFDESGGGNWPGTVSANAFTEGGTALSSKYAPKSHSHTYYSRSSVGDIGWGTSSNQGLPTTVAAIAYWNGAYSGTNSNLTYCAKGAFGTMATQNTSNYVKSQKLTQSSYNSATKDANTLYIIVG